MKKTLILFATLISAVAPATAAFLVGKEVEDKTKPLTLADKTIALIPISFSKADVKVSPGTTPGKVVLSWTNPTGATWVKANQAGSQSQEITNGIEFSAKAGDTITFDITPNSTHEVPSQAVITLKDSDINGALDLGNTQIPTPTPKTPISFSRADVTVTPGTSPGKVVFSWSNPTGALSVSATQSGSQSQTITSGNEFSAKVGDTVTFDVTPDSTHTAPAQVIITLQDSDIKAISRSGNIQVPTQSPKTPITFSRTDVKVSPGTTQGKVVLSWTTPPGVSSDTVTQTGSQTQTITSGTEFSAKAGDTITFDATLPDGTHSTLSHVVITLQDADIKPVPKTPISFSRADIKVSPGSTPGKTVLTWITPTGALSVSATQSSGQTISSGVEFNAKAGDTVRFDVTPDSTHIAPTQVVITLQDADIKPIPKTPINFSRTDVKVSPGSTPGKTVLTWIDPSGATSVSATQLGSQSQTITSGTEFSAKAGDTVTFDVTPDSTHIAPTQVVITLQDSDIKAVPKPVHKTSITFSRSDVTVNPGTSPGKTVLTWNTPKGALSVTATQSNGQIITSGTEFSAKAGDTITFDITPDSTHAVPTQVVITLQNSDIKVVPKPAHKNPITFSRTDVKVSPGSTPGKTVLTWTAPKGALSVSATQSSGQTITSGTEFNAKAGDTITFDITPDSTHIAPTRVVITLQDADIKPAPKTPINFSRTDVKVSPGSTPGKTVLTWKTPPGASSVTVTQTGSQTQTITSGTEFNAKAGDTITFTITPDSTHVAPTQVVITLQNPDIKKFPITFSRTNVKVSPGTTPGKTILTWTTPPGASSVTATQSSGQTITSGVEFSAKAGDTITFDVIPDGTHATPSHVVITLQNSDIKPIPNTPISFPASGVMSKPGTSPGKTVLTWTDPPGATSVTATQSSGQTITSGTEFNAKAGDTITFDVTPDSTHVAPTQVVITLQDSDIKSVPKPVKTPISFSSADVTVIPGTRTGTVSLNWVVPNGAKSVLAQQTGSRADRILSFDSFSAKAGDTITFTITPDDTYAAPAQVVITIKQSDIKAAPKPVVHKTPISFSGTDIVETPGAPGKTVLTWTTPPGALSVTATQSGGQTISSGTEFSAKAGDAITFTITPDSTHKAPATFTISINYYDIGAAAITHQQHSGNPVSSFKELFPKHLQHEKIDDLRIGGKRMTMTMFSTPFRTTSKAIGYLQDLRNLEVKYGNGWEPTGDAYIDAINDVRFITLKQALGDSLPRETYYNIVKNSPSMLSRLTEGMFAPAETSMKSFLETGDLSFSTGLGHIEPGVDPNNPNTTHAWKDNSDIINNLKPIKMSVVAMLWAQERANQMENNGWLREPNDGASIHDFMMFDAAADKREQAKTPNPFLGDRAMDLSSRAAAPSTGENTGQMVQVYIDGLPEIIDASKVSVVDALSDIWDYFLDNHDELKEIGHRTNLLYTLTTGMGWSIAIANLNHKGDDNSNPKYWRQTLLEFTKMANISQEKKDILKYFDGIQFLTANVNEISPITIIDYIDVNKFKSIEPTLDGMTVAQRIDYFKENLFNTDPAKRLINSITTLEGHFGFTRIVDAGSAAEIAAWKRSGQLGPYVPHVFSEDELQKIYYDFINDKAGDRIKLYSVDDSKKTAFEKALEKIVDNPLQLPSYGATLHPTSIYNLLGTGTQLLYEDNAYDDWKSKTLPKTDEYMGVPASALDGINFEYRPGYFKSGGPGQSSWKQFVNLKAIPKYFISLTIDQKVEWIKSHIFTFGQYITDIVAFDKIIFETVNLSGSSQTFLNTDKDYGEFLKTLNLNIGIFSIHKA